MRRFVSTRTLVLTIAILSTIAALGGWLLLDQSGPARRHGEIVVSIDMNPTGNSCPGDGVNDCTVGTIDPSIQETAARESGAACAASNVADEDGDTRVNDGCPAVGAAETTCTGAADEDADTFINDGCPTAFLFDVVIENLPLTDVGAGQNGQGSLDFRSSGAPPTARPISSI